MVAKDSISNAKTTITNVKPDDLCCHILHADHCFCRQSNSLQIMQIFITTELTCSKRSVIRIFSYLHLCCTLKPVFIHNYSTLGIFWIVLLAGPLSMIIHSLKCILQCFFQANVTSWPALITAKLVREKRFKIFGICYVCE